MNMIFKYRLQIYLTQDDIESSFQKVIDERPKRWIDFFIKYYNTQAFGKTRDLQGLEGTIKGIKEIGEFQEELVKYLDIKKYILNNSHFDKKK